MLKVVCTHCGQTVSVAPDAENCSICGTNLRNLMSEEHASDFFYARAERLAIEKDYSSALAEAQQGAYYANSPDLHLLSAILAERQNKYDLMRRHVSAIPIDDRLREEGEWLLRSHQERQRAKRIGSTNRKDASDIRPSNALAPKSEHQSGGLTSVVATLLVVTAIVWVIWSGRAEGLLQSVGLSPAIEIVGDTPTIPATSADGTTTAPDLATSARDGSAPVEDASFADGPAPNNLAPNNPASVESDSQPREGSPIEQPNEDNTPSDQAPIENLPNDLLEDSATPEPIAETQPAKVAEFVNTRPFDILAFLSEVGRNDLAALSIDAQIQDGNLTIVGVVPWAEHRREIIELAQYAPSVTDINAVDLVVRSPDTYQVVEGDTLWLIAYRLYDDAALWPQLVDANRNIIPAPEALRSDQVLRVPPKK